MFLLDWVYGVLAALGLYYKSGRILFLGLDNAGKTTLLHVLKEGRVSVAQPTHHPQQDELIIGRVRFRAFDMGGHESARQLWKDYYASGVDGVVFMVDAVDRDRFPEAKRELDGLLTADELSQVPVLVLGNKIDMRIAASEDDLRQELGLYETYGKDGPKATSAGGQAVRPVELYMCSVVRKMGYGDGFKWLAQFL